MAPAYYILMTRPIRAEYLDCSGPMRELHCDWYLLNNITAVPGRPSSALQWQSVTTSQQPRTCCRTSVGNTGTSTSGSSSGSGSSGFIRRLNCTDRAVRKRNNQILILSSHHCVLCLVCCVTLRRIKNHSCKFKQIIIWNPGISVFRNFLKSYNWDFANIIFFSWKF